MLYGKPTASFPTLKKNDEYGSYMENPLSFQRATIKQGFNGQKMLNPILSRHSERKYKVP